MKQKSKLLYPLVSVSSSLLFITSASAQTWDGGGADDNWSTANNWNTNVAPVSGATITLGGSARLTNVNDLADGFLVGGLTFSNSSTAGNMSISGNRITLGGNITATAQPGGAPFMMDTIGFAMTLNGDRTINNNQRHGLTFNGAIGETGGSRSLTKQGTGIMVLGADNTFSGTMFHTAGLLVLNKSLALQNATLNTTNYPTATTGNTGNSVTGVRVGVTTLTFGGVTGSKNLAIVTDAANTTTNIFNGGGGYASVTALTLNPGTGKDLNFTGAIANGANNMTLTKTGAGSQTLSGTNTYTGATRINVGTLRINGSTHSSSAFTVTSGATLAGAGTVNGSVALSGDLAPGNGTTAAGTLTTGTTTWNNSGIFNFDLGTTSDRLTVSGVFTKGTASAGDGKFTFNFSGSPTLHTPITVVGFSSTTFSLADFKATGIAGNFSMTTSILQFTPIPEASNLLIGGLLGLGLMSRRRKNA